MTEELIKKSFTEGLNKQLQLKVDSKIEVEFQNFLESILGIEGMPNALRPMIENLVVSKKHLFWADYSKRLEYELKNPSVDIFKTTDFNRDKDRLFLERYFKFKGDKVKAANSLNVPKSTYYDWCTEHKELIVMEQNKDKVITQ